MGAESPVSRRNNDVSDDDWLTYEKNQLYLEDYYDYIPSLASSIDKSDDNNNNNNQSLSLPETFISDSVPITFLNHIYLTDDERKFTE
jgi:hypothetical protein